MNHFRLLFIILFISVATSGQLYINEFMASNASTIKDPDYNNDADWIELYNDGTTSVNLNGYYLTDNLNTPGKWMIGNVTIAAKDFVIFWADGMNTGNHTSFKLDAQIEEIGFFKPDLSVVDTIRYGIQNPDISEGRNQNNLAYWGHFAKATPNAANTTEFFSDFALNEPIFNIRGGIYNANQSITLFTDLGGEIRYTLDGSDPTLTSPLYTIPIQISTTTVVRARVFKPNMMAGPIITNTYFINDLMETRGLPAVSLATNPGNFWDPTNGIYVQTFKPDWEVPVNIELFENNGADRAAFNEQAGVKINGLYSWQLPQKMLGVYFKKRYGTGTLDNTLFFDSPRSGFKTFALRASGDDWSNTLMRDILGQNATQLNMNLDISAFRWCTVYVNGQYMGIHNFREKIETDYIEKHYGMAAGTFDMVENEDYAECGDLVSYTNLKALFSKDLSIQANFDSVAAKMNIENFTDLVIAETASGNSSVDHNVMAWKPKDSGKWKWILMDLDRGFVDPSAQLISFYVGQTSFPFKNLMANAAYKTYFGKRLADHLYTSYDPLLMKNLIEKHRATIAPEIPKHVARWLGTTSSYGNAMPSVEYWNNEVLKLKTFVEARPAVLLNDLNNYGFNGTASLMLSVYPENAGILKLNGFKIAGNSITGPYLKNVNAEIITEEKAGYSFKGWANAVKKTLVAKQSIWKYLDDGTNQGTTWFETAFNDASWKSGQGELGYGDGGEKTIISYGSGSSNKYITTYFRHSFSISEADKTGSNYMINLMRDDGAVVYLNGVEVVRDNIKTGIIDYNTLTPTSIGGTAESTYYSFPVDKNLLVTGNNVISVEVHQNAANSSDISFDLELVCYVSDNNGYVSTAKNYPVTLTGDLNLIAVYEAGTACVVPAVISENTTLYKSCSPYLVRDDVTINSGVTVTIEPGVEIWISPKSNFYIHGNMNAIGTSAERIIFKINPQYKPEGWGALCFWNTSATSNLGFVTIDDATRSPIPLRLGAISGYLGNLNLDNILINNTKLNPIFTRYSDVTLTNSFIHSSVTSDLVNFKYGHAKIENCTFVGNSEFDSDGIDYDGIENGVIRNTKLINILGNNADAIDIGEEAMNVIIDSVLIVNAYDKGISVGQRSSVVLTNSVLINCNMGLGVKDSSWVDINHCTFYGNGSAVSCYEKNPGRAGGNAKVRNSILSNASMASYQSDDKSKTQFMNCLSDNEKLTSDPSNRFGNPLFADPTHYDFSLLAGSPGISSGSDNGQITNMGAKIRKIEMEPDALICRIYIDPLNSGNPEYLALYNPSTKTLDLSNYSLVKGVNCIIPQGTVLASGDTLFVTSNATGWNPNRKVVQWTDGKLANEGEEIELLNQYGMVADHIRFSVIDGWPVEAFNSETFLALNGSKVDNHFPVNWKAISVISSLTNPLDRNKSDIHIYPNPATDKLMITTGTEAKVELYSALGQLLKQTNSDQNGVTTISVSDLNAGVYLIKVGTKTAKVLITR
ncbi:MAG TPA: CotH kinase family protein [Paludibacter sp.]